MPPTRLAPSPNHSGPRARTLGCVLHGTRGGARTVELEYVATLNWFANQASQVSSHIVVVVNGEVAYVVDEDLIAWHDPSTNATHLGVELVQPRQGDAISDAQVRSLAWWLRKMAVRYGFPLEPVTLPFHSQTPTGAAQGKSDPYPLGDADGGEFRRRLLDALPEV